MTPFRRRPITREVPTVVMAANAANYPWFGVVEGDGIEQGDILEGCPVDVAPENWTA